MTMTTPQLMALLRRHYIKPGAPLAGGVFLEEVGWNGGVAAGRADAIYIGLTGTSGRLLVGHEVKVSRADWLAELRKPGKADAWADECHAWNLVTLPGVVADGELPEGWGLMLPGKSKTRMQIATPARVYADRTPSWDAMRSITGRQDTLRAQATAAGIREARTEAQADIDERVTALVAARLRHTPSDAAAQLELERYRSALGRLVETEPGWPRDGITPERLASLAALIAGSRSLRIAAGELRRPYLLSDTAAMRAAADAFDTAAATLVDDVAKAHDLEGSRS